MTTFTLIAQRTYDVAPESMWPVVADLDGYADHVAGLAATTVLSGDGLGAVRQCTTTRNDSWTERVSDWQPARSYTLTVDTAGYPLPLRWLFRAFQGTWTLERVGAGSEVTIRFTADVRGGLLTRPLIALMARTSRRHLEDTLTSYGRAAAVT
jgi:hypothetical protein